MVDKKEEVRNGLADGRLYGVTVGDEPGTSRTFNAFWHEQEAMFYLHDRTWERTRTMEFRLTPDADIMVEAMHEIAALDEWKELGAPSSGRQDPRRRAT